MDAFERVVRLRVFGWSLVGAFLGFLIGVFASLQGAGGAGVIALTTLLGGTLSYVGPLMILKFAGRAGSVLFAPSGRSTPHKREHSLAESYVARGLIDEAIAAFEEAIAEDPTDPAPYVRVARLLRDRKNDDEGAARWFKRVLSDSSPTSGGRMLAARELLELCEVRMGDARRATPTLARMSETDPDPGARAWATAELARIKSEMTERDGA